MKKLVLSFYALSSFFILSAQQTPQPDSLKEYTGKYKFPEGSVVTEVTVTIENGELYATSVMGNSELKKIEKDVFEIVSFSGKAFFKRNEEAKLSGVRIEVEDVILEGTKSEESIQTGEKLQRLMLK